MGQHTETQLHFTQHPRSMTSSFFVCLFVDLQVFFFLMLTQGTHFG